MESSFTQSMSMSNDSLAIFFTRPISCVILIATVILIIISVRLMLRTRARLREVQDGDDDFVDEN